MKFLMTALFALTPALAHAGDVCENYAKYFAIRDYKSHGTVQGSEGIQYESELIYVDTYQDRDEYLYKVAITDNNEDGEYWTTNYDVLLEQAKGQTKCHLLKLKSEIED